VGADGSEFRSAFEQSCLRHHLRLFVLIVGVALTDQSFWLPKLNQVVSWIVSPILFLVGIRFQLVVLKLSEVSRVT
jgi:hypothetical protein